TALVHVAGAVDQGQLPGVEERHQIIKVRVQRCETVAEPNRVRLQDAWVVGLAGRCVVKGGGILRQADGGAVEIVTRIIDGNEVVDSVIAAAQEDEEQLFAAEADVAFRQRALEEEGNIGEGGQAGKDAGLQTGFEKRPSSDDVSHTI